MKLVFALAAWLAYGFPGVGFAQAPAPAPAPAAPAPATRAAPRQAAAPASSARIDLNRATEQQLVELPGIGPARAKAIIAARPIAKPGDLVTKKVLSQAVFDGLKDRIALANINHSTAAEMIEVLPGIGDVRAAAIVAGRPYAKPDDLVSKGVLTEALFANIKDVVAY